MASVTITIPTGTGRWVYASSRRGWSLNDNLRVSLGSTLSATNIEQFLAVLEYRPGDNQIRLGLAAGQVGGVGDGMEDFTEQMEEHGTITIVASDNSSIVITGISNDGAEPYIWAPSNYNDFVSFIDDVNGLTDRSATITFDDNAIQLFERVSGSYEEVTPYERVSGAYEEVTAIFERVSGAYER